MSLRSNDQFDNFRRERQRMRAKLGPVAGLGYENKALRELEQVEAREQLEQRLTKEVHEFFATATRQAADIVERVAHDAQEQAGQRVEQEMESFLIDALARMNSFVVSMLQQRRPPVASTEMEPRVKRIVGDSLDEFRWEGTADVGDKHIGQDPFDTDVDEVRREFRAQVGEAAPAEQQLPIEEHKVAAAHGDDEPEQASADESEAEPAAESEPATAPATAVAEPAEPEAAAAAEPRGPSPAEELERFKSALKSLVRQGTMSRDEAKAAWQARLQKLGLA
ncbi:MAG: hypothetical protein JNL08_16010 [Planctomycetes bacterium]|nr:hypothetical protein [Planctomycetota bacterium]